MSRIGFHHSQAVPEAVVTGAFHVYVLHVAAGEAGFDPVSYTPLPPKRTGSAFPLQLPDPHTARTP